MSEPLNYGSTIWDGVKAIRADAWDQGYQAGKADTVDRLMNGVDEPQSNPYKGGGK